MRIITIPAYNYIELNSSHSQKVSGLIISLHPDTMSGVKKDSYIEFTAINFKSTEKVVHIKEIGHKATIYHILKRVVDQNPSGTDNPNLWYVDKFGLKWE